MKIIRELSEMIEEELEGAEEYAKNACYYKEEYQDLAKVFYDLSMAEMKHVDMLHGEVTAIIEKYRAEHGEPPAAMLAVYEYLHKKDIEKANKIRNYQTMYRGA